MLNMQNYEMELMILGERWEIKVDPSLKDTWQGLCDFSIRTIYINDFNKYVDYDNVLQNLNTEILRTIRHEIVHALFFESGLAEYGNDEVLVDFLAVQFPKLRTIVGEIESTVCRREVMNYGK